MGPYPALPWRRPRSNHCKSTPAGPAGQLLLHQVIILSVRHPSDENVPSETSERGGQDHVSGGVAALEGRRLGAEHGRVEVPVVAARSLLVYPAAVTPLVVPPSHRSSGSCVQPAADTLGDHMVTFCNSASE